jgi:spore germination protein GerM
VFEQIMQTFSWPEATTTSTPPATTILVYFYRTPELTVEPVQRVVYSTNLPEAALTEMFKGPTSEDQAGGLTFFADGVTGFSNLTTNDGITYVYLTGNCNSQGSTFTIASTIRSTLLQFPEIQHVRIYDQNGNTENPDPGTDSIPACLEP